ncbi:putative cation-transporting ATPase 13A2 isoform A [Alligator mississippiensis]|uniref:Probable cation-transporting ATPase 13A5 n=1 Tax=Alligator mississippiensis TaxID=8496 RepID=A0A151NTX0_ALLMI|nr:putative cation-transporting ATPase 13A2 isoform A [Alligator mississippiensis]
MLPGRKVCSRAASLGCNGLNCLRQQSVKLHNLVEEHNRVQQSASDTITMALLLLTVPVPPAIPAALTTAIVYAQRRLKQKQIFCISPQRINICGQINLVCFEKDEFHLYSRKVVTWISVSALPSFKPGHPLVADESSVINEALMKPDLKVRCIQVQKIRYLWNISGKRFQKIGCLEDHHTCSDMHDKFGSGLSHEDQAIRRLICGPNTIDVRVVPIWKLLVKEVLHPFYVFQLFSICLWFADDYMEYASAILLMSLLSVSLTVYDLRKQSVKLHRLVESHTNVTVTVFRKMEGCQKVKSHQLVPGDTLVLTEGKSFLPCDAVLISGRCIVNESMLTGESIPVTKAPLPYANNAEPWKTHCSEEYKRHILFCGTEVIQTKADGEGLVKAIVLQTGFNTAKGDLVRSILYPKPINFKLYRDAMSFLMCLIALATAGMIYTVCIFALNGEEPGDIVKKALDIITIAVPPALPAALTTGIIYTQRRLKNKGIFCISPQRINMCGQLNLFCFDKTGTLTEDGLDLLGVVPAEGNRFQEVHSFASGQTLPWGPVCGAMVSCHSLVLLEGRTQGDPLDLKMFEATGWELEESGGDHAAGGGSVHTTMIKPGPKAGQVPVRGMAILHHFPFTSALRRMSVIAQEIGGAQHVFMKGAPETVAEFCRPETVPSQLTSELQLYTAQGFRVIGLAHRVLQAGNQTARLIRKDVESGLVFLGLLIMENRLKRETKPVLEELSAACIRNVMVTGDNIQTAVTVAKNASMISPTSQVILVEAKELPGTPAASVTWTLMEGSHLNGSKGLLLLNGTVFARMSPGQKSSLVEEFQKLGYYVGMCGDGANDCGALKVAHAGISLSEEEASVASPFTTRTPTIECVPQLIREGRAALVTSLCMFKYMALYSIIQYLGVLLLYWQLNSFGNYQFLFQDLAINTVIGVTMSLNGAYPKLVPYRPPSQLVSPPLLLSLVLHILFSLGLQICGFLVVQEQPWYSKEDISSACLSGKTSLANHSSSSSSLNGMGNATLGQEVDNGFKSYENSTVWLLSTINCIAVALVVSKGKPFRQPAYTNYQFVLALTVQLGVCIFLMFADMEGVYSIFDLVCTPPVWRVSMLIMLAITFAASLLVEDEFQRYTRKKVTWTDLSTLTVSVSDKPDGLLIADKDSIINRAIMKPELKVRCIQVQKIRYIWDISAKQFHKVGSLEDSNSCNDMHQKFGAGLTREEQNIRRLVCGPNAIEIEIRPIWKLLFKEILNPFYVFQAFTLTLWITQGYVEYSVAIIILSIISISLTVFDLRQQSVKLHNLVEEHNRVQVKACTKDEGCKTLESHLLVPGDVLVLEGKKLSLPCDAVLIDGGCIVNEGMLTGESIPVTKTALPHADNTMPWKTHSVEDYRRHVLFCGTEVIQTKPSGRGPVRAVVLQTGFNTAKGDLVRSILYPKPVNFKLYRDAFKFIVGLAVIGVLGLIYTVCVYAYRKTGTLTEDGLDLWGVIPSEGSRFQNVHSFTSGAPLPWGPVCGAMASCHSLALLDGKIQGDPLDLKMFEGTNWEMEDPSDTEGLDSCIVIKPGPNASNAPVEGIVILHQFPFSSALQRMAVVTQEVGKNQYDLYMKGAPEMVASFCRPETVPTDFVKELQVYTTQGFRVIALAHKALNVGKDVAVDSLEREDVESGLAFLGLLIMENRLKRETKPVLEELSAARIRSVMVTGDNLQTAVTVAKNSEMIPKSSPVILIEANEPEGTTPASITWQLMEESKQATAETNEVYVDIETRTPPDRDVHSHHFAMNGKSYQVIVKHFSSLLPKILVNGTVFARMSPNQKSSLVEEFQNLNYYVGMCGDGANDCGALKAAHAGISLSEQEASVASPFTSQIPNIECVPELIREGRAALVASFAVFKYLTLYGLIQFIGTSLLFWQLQIFGNYQYLIEDVGITLLVCLTMSLTHAYPKLAPYRPPGQLISPPLLLSIVLNVCFTTTILFGGFLLVKQQPWYSETPNPRGCPQPLAPVSTATTNATHVSSSVLSYEGTTMWPLATINCIIIAFVFSKGKPFRKPIYTNYIFSLFLLLQLGICIFILFADIDAVYRGMELLCTPTMWRVYILITALVTFCVSFVVEDLVLQNRRLWLLIKKCFGFRSKSQYRKWQRKLATDPTWPPLQRTDFAENGKNEIYTNPAYEHSEEK